MLFLIFAAYSLLSFPVRGCARVFVSGIAGKALIELRAAGICFCYEASEKLGEYGWPLHTAPVFTPPQEEPSRGNDRSGHMRRILVSGVRRAAAVQRIDAVLRIGTGDAWSTAIAAGGAKAAVLAGLGVLRAPRDTHVAVMPDFASRVFVLRLRCIFSLTVGDIMLSAVKTAIKKRRKEGM